MPRERHIACDKNAPLEWRTPAMTCRGFTSPSSGNLLPDEVDERTKRRRQMATTA
jgi:hypothetical protein